MLLIDNYVYCCGGLNNHNILKSCERYNIEHLSKLLVDEPLSTQEYIDICKQEWQQDLPNLNKNKFSSTMISVDRRWIYSFGGASYETNEQSKGLEIERLDLQTIGTDLAKWEQFDFKFNYVKCCQQGVIRLKNGPQSERRFLIFGGVFNSFIDLAFIFTENPVDMKKSTCTEANKVPRLNHPDKFYYQQPFPLKTLP